MFLLQYSDGFRVGEGDLTIELGLHLRYCKHAWGRFVKDTRNESSFREVHRRQRGEGLGRRWFF